MAGAKEIKNRIKSVQSTHQITRAENLLNLVVETISMALVIW